jgi:hypothetical protein
MKKFIAIIAFLAAFQTLFAQDHSNWKRSIVGLQGCAMISTCATADKCVVLFSLYRADGKEQFTLTKLNGQGERVWQYSFENQVFKEYDFYPSFLEIQPDEFILASNNVLIRCNSSGKVLYKQTMKPVDGFLQTHSIVVLNKKTIGVAGVSFDIGRRQPKAWYALYTPQLQLISQKVMELPLEYEPHRAILTTNLDLVITGMVQKDTLECKKQKDAYCKNMFLKSWNLQGKASWEVSFNESYTPSFLKQNANGAILMTYSGGQRGKCGFTGNFIKVSAQGKILQDIHYSIPNDENPYTHFEDVVETPDNGFLLVGCSDYLNNAQRNYIDGGEIDFFVVKLDWQGNMRWQQELGGSKDDKAQFIVKTIDNQYIVVGYSSSKDWDVTDAPFGEIQNQSFVGWVWCVGISDE